MKKTILFAALMTFATLAMANTVTVEATHLNNKTNKVAIVPSFDVKGLTVDARLEGANSNNDANTNELELRVGKTYSLAPALTANVRVGAGKSFGPNVQAGKLSNDYKFYSIEPSVKYALSPVMAVKVSDRYTNSFGSGKNVSQHEFGVGAEYAVSKVDTFAATVIHQKGDLSGKGVKLAYIRSF